MELSEEYMYDYVHANPNLVSIKDQPTVGENIKVLKYKKKVFYKNLWTPEVMECRGTVVWCSDETKRLKILQRPPTKTFNRFENNRDLPLDTMVTAPRKINGFMGALTFIDGCPFVSTTGSCDSPFSKMAYQMLMMRGSAFKLAESYGAGITWTFEIVHKDDPHIVPEDTGVYLLSARRTEWNVPSRCFDESTLDKLAAEHSLKRPEWYRMHFGDVVTMNQTVNHEGFMVYTDDGYEMKLKSPRYIVSKFLARLSPIKLQGVLFNDPIQFESRFGGEFMLLRSFLQNRYTGFLGATEQQRLSVIREFFRLIK